MKGSNGHELLAKEGLPWCRNSLRWIGNLLVSRSNVILAWCHCLFVIWAPHLLIFCPVLQAYRRNCECYRNSYLFINPLSANPTKWSNTLKQFVGCCRRIVWVCLTILWDWLLRGWYGCYAKAHSELTTHTILDVWLDYECASVV